jgi:NAD(P)-dependent dehydrogenase (short-subunit alcohol dehydrogenase family)
VDKVIAVLGVGPGLGLSVARRFSAEGYSVALASRTAVRHDAYRAALGESRAYTADLTDPERIHDVVARVKADLGRLDVVYFGPAAPGRIVPLPDAEPDAVAESLASIVLPAVSLTRAVLPDMRRNGDGALLFPGGLSGLRPMPMLGNLAPASAALRMYALTLHAALTADGVYVGTLTIGGLIAGGDIYRMFTDRPGGETIPTLNPDTLADAAWRMVTERADAERVFEAERP